MLALSIAGLFFGYRFYGGFIARQFRLDESATTPAVAHADGKDFVPTKRFYLLGQHFSAISAAGPIAGPIVACKAFGWLPCILWIVFGVILIGAVHDFSTLIASVRHDARSIAEVVRKYLGRPAFFAIMAFIWLALVYVLLAFVDVTAATFATQPVGQQGALEGIDPGGAVALGATLYLGIAVVMGFVERLLKPPLWLQTLVFVPLTIACIWLGTELSTTLQLGWTAWAILIVAYCFVAALCPVWALLQPRGYLGGFFLYIALAVGVIGIAFGGFDIQQDWYKGFDAGGENGLLIPFLFVTIACGACSGFHGLVCSGTTSKQIASEPHCKPIGYGAMTLEAFVAVIALGTVMIASQDSLADKGAGAIYASGIGKFFTVLIGEDNLGFAMTFGGMAFSTFVFDTLDVSTRLGRYILQELFGATGKVAAVVATAVTAAVPLAILLASKSGAFMLFWQLFGSSNQLLAALSLLAIWVWLKRANKRSWFVLWPMLFVLAITITALALQTRLVVADTAIERINGVVALAQIGLALILLYYAIRAIFPGRPASVSAG